CEQAGRRACYSRARRGFDANPQPRRFIFLRSLRCRPSRRKSTAKPAEHRTPKRRKAFSYRHPAGGVLMPLNAQQKDRLKLVDQICSPLSKRSSLTSDERRVINEGTDILRLASDVADG